MLLCDGNLVGVLQNATEGVFCFYSFKCRLRATFLFFETAAAVPKQSLRGLTKSLSLAKISRGGTGDSKEREWVHHSPASYR